MVPIGKRLVGCERDNHVVVLDMIGAAGIRLGKRLDLVTGADICSLVPSLTNRVLKA